MRARVEKNGLIAQAVAGTYVVLIGWDIKDQLIRQGLLGFAIQRTDHTENEIAWLRGMKTFPGSDPLPLGGNASSHEQPFQSFQWADYAAKPGHNYTYRLVAMKGAPGTLVDANEISIDIATEPEWGEDHSVFFNRGAIASQEYAKRFQNKPPNEAGPAAYIWLSRGLLEAILAFIGQATGPEFALRIAIYEFQLPEILGALNAAKERGVDVQVLFDAIENAEGNPVHPNEEQIAAAGITDFCTGITEGKIMHNKFIVLLQRNKPLRVLSGSTNFTENGVFGHLNCAHVVHDDAVAAKFMEYWDQLSKNQPLGDLRKWTGPNSTPPPQPPDPGTSEVFSPQTGADTLKRYAVIASEAKRGLFMTFAFGMNAEFQAIYANPGDVLRFALMDTVGVGKNKATGEKQIEVLQRLPNTVIAIGQNITLNEFDRWIKERDGLAPGEHVRWVHTKFMLVDPLSDDPIVITGSQNFSVASIETNHENMLVIRGNTRIADIYLGEFMRQFSSYAFRDAAKNAVDDKTGMNNFKPQDLFTDNSWLNRYDNVRDAGGLRRLYFSGQ
ncbi:phospholipase D-like domain-containing protein [Rhizobium calliandrae]|uniref:Phospholipase D n=1 Tax=Rhizobium calliandrae TaxID=1312182 RepID=A0ABT7KIP1_9HYPH|nr:phospholipase D-like domain-containing protein [Rhizobium calliandrae]MDL2408501.1 phospholipase D-like domain-containing protein [Rhizobium calliandrae]